MYLFFFSSRRRHTRYWRDWSSDVCSSDLTKRSYELFERAKTLLPGGTNSTARTTYAGWEPYPLFAASGDGAYLIDADGRRYIDYLLALGPLMLGHRPANVTARVLDAVASYG